MSAQTTTEQLLALLSEAAHREDPDSLRSILLTAHPLYCQTLDDVRAHVTAQTSSFDDAQLARWCAEAGAPWPEGVGRDEAVSELVFVLFDATPAAMAYQELADRAHRRHADLID